MRKERIVKLVILLLLIFSGSIYSKKLTPSVTITKVEGILAFGNTILFTASGHDNDSQNGGQAPRIEWDFSYEEASGFTVDAVTNNESASTVTHIYDRKGTYTVIARYYDNDGARKDSYRQITISGLKRYYYVKDHLGNIRQTLDTELNVVSAQDYAPYGAMLREYNESSPNEKYKFTEKERDKESNFDYFGARYYDSDIGRWLSVDPLADKFPGHSPYNYTLNNPLNNIDPDGKEPITLTATGLVGLGIAATALTAHTYNYLTNPSYRRSYDSFINSAYDVTSDALNDAFEGVSNLISSDETENGPSVGEQAGEISKEIGKNSVTLPDGTRVDLKGRGHRTKSGEKTETPHTHEVETNTNPKTGETFTKTKKVPRPTTQEDLDKVKEIIKKQQGN